MQRKLYAYLIPVLTLVSFAGWSPAAATAQTTPAAAAAARHDFRAGQTMYIVAYRRAQLPVLTETVEVNVTRPDYIDNDLDAEREVRKEIERWGFFKVAEKLRDAAFIFLVHIEDSSIEGLAVPPEAYRRHYKDKFDLDELRDAAYGRYQAGPLKLPSANRLSDRLVKNFRETLAGKSTLAH